MSQSFTAQAAGENAIQILSAALANTIKSPRKRGGNNKDRRARKHWLLSHFGNGTTCKCVHCSKELDFQTVEADRIVPGATYARENLQPACRRCNAQRGDNTHWVGPKPLSLEGLLA